MFTLDQIKAAHSKVKSGADFPAYVKEIKALGVQQYTTHVHDRHTDYEGAGGFRVSSPAGELRLTIAGTTDRTAFQSALKQHQQGNTDFPTFLADCARYGIANWVVRMDAMTCTYYGVAGEEVLVEAVLG